MRVDAIINVPEMRGHAELPARRVQADDMDSLIAQKDKAAIDGGMQSNRQEKDKKVEPVNNDMNPGLKPVFALDENKSVVIRFLDKDGKVVRQFPPEEYINMVKKFNEIVDSIYSKKV